jgi:hypothetical protein
VGVNRLKADNRADEVGILRTQWDNIALSSKQRLASTDEGFKDAVSLTFRANLPPDVVFEVVQALNAVRSSARQQALVKSSGCPSRPHPGVRRWQPRASICALTPGFPPSWRGGDNLESCRGKAAFTILAQVRRFISVPNHHDSHAHRALPDPFWDSGDRNDPAGCWPLIAGGETTRSGHIASGGMKKRSMPTASPTSSPRALLKSVCFGTSATTLRVVSRDT